MANYKTDHDDILFNLNQVLNISQYEQFGLDENSIKEILLECDKFVENEIYPTRQKSDEEGVRLVDGKVVVPECLKKATKGYYEMGWYALGMSEEIGGTPVPEALASSCRALSQGANTAWSMYPGLTKGAMNVLNKVGDDYIKSTFIPKIMEGAWGGTMCLTESGAGSDVGNLKTTAKPIEGREGWYKIKGTKIFISSGENDLYENNINLVLARTPKGVEGTKGISLFVVPKTRVNIDGTLGEDNDVNCPSFEHKMGIHASATCVLNFGDNDNCEGYLIGKEFEGMNNMFIMMNEARLDCGLQGESQASLVYQLTKQYVSERVQFGVEIEKHPDVKKMLLKMRAMSRGLRALSLYTCDLLDKAHGDEKYQKYLEFLTPICKSFCSEQGFNIAVEAVQAHGGYGYCSEYGIEQFVRDTKIATIYEGTNGIQSIDFLLRKTLKDQGSVLKEIGAEIEASIARLGDDFKIEKKIFSSVFTTSKKALEFIGEKAMKKEMSIVLQSSKDYLDLNSHLIVAWRLMVSAIKAQELLESDSSNQEFLESKIVDFKVYCTQYLVHANAFAESIMLTDQDFSKCKL